MILDQLLSGTPVSESPVRCAAVTYTGAEGFGALADGEYRSPGVVSPGGLEWKPRQEDTLLLLASSEGALCAGVVAPPGDLLPGELRLSGPAGSFLWLKSDGSVVINGAVFSPAGVLTQGGA